MMYKKICSLLLSIITILACTLTVYGEDSIGEMLQDDYQTQRENNIDKITGEADILLIYEPVLGEDERIKSIEALSNMAISLVKSMEMATVEESLEYINSYDYIICYNIIGDERILAQSLALSEAKVMIIGGNFMHTYITANNLSQTPYTLNTTDVGILNYTFSAQSYFEEIVELSTISNIEYNGYQNGTVIIDEKKYPFCGDAFDVRFIPVTNLTTDLAYTSVINEIRTWMWIYNDAPPQYGQYLVLDSVDSFLPADDLLSKVELLVNSNLPFVISVMPVYQNYDYPAMQQFCEVLKYAQTNGGGIILHAPIIRGDIDDLAEFYSLITETTNAYTQQGVYPLGIEIPKSWIYNDQILTWLKRYKTVFIYEDNETSNFSTNIKRNLLYYNYHQLILPSVQLDDTNMHYLSAYTSAIYVDNSTTDINQLNTVIENCKNSRGTFRNLWDFTHSVWADNFHLSYEDRTVTINDITQPLTYIPQDYDIEYDYQRNILHRITVDIQNQSHVLIFFVSLVTILFVFMIWLFRQRVKHRFFYAKNTDKKGEDKNVSH